MTDKRCKDGRSTLTFLIIWVPSKVRVNVRLCSRCRQRGSKPLDRKSQSLVDLLMSKDEEEPKQSQDISVK